MSQSINTLYGAFELKRLYQKNMMIGTMAVTIMAATIIASIWIYGYLLPDVAVPLPPDPPPPDSTIIIIGNRPEIEYERPPGGPPIPPQPKTDIFTGSLEWISGNAPESEETIIDDPPEFYVVFTGDDPGSGGEGEYEGFYPTGYSNNYIPPSTTFVPHEIPPEVAIDVKPEYPDIAMDYRFTAILVIEAFVGTDGHVKKVQVAKCSRPNMGFEEEALKAAYECIYRPAIQNGDAVGVWITYKVKFSLD
jgi:TonB family protein